MRPDRWWRDGGAFEGEDKTGCILEGPRRPLSMVTMAKKDWCSWSVQHHKPVAAELERIRMARSRARPKFVLCGGDHLLKILVVRL